MIVMTTSAHFSSDPRSQQLQSWLAQLPEFASQLRLKSFRPASADASFRKFYRVDNQAGLSLIAIDAPPATENNAAYLKNAELFKKLHLTVPEVFAHDLQQGFFLVSDLGTETYAHVINHDNAHHLYLDAIDALVLMQAQSQPEVFPEFDRAFIERELGIFKEWYIDKHLQVSLTEQQQTTLAKVLEHITATVLAQPQVYMHRDFHSRNLIWRQQGNPGIVDFQDAVYGPITYDLVSLLRDAYQQWDEELVLDWAIRYWEKARKAGLPVADDIDSFYRDFEITGLQRHLKILGLFVRLSKRDGKHHLLGDIPTVMEYVRRTCNRYRELVPLLRLLDSWENREVQSGYTF